VQEEGVTIRAGWARDGGAPMDDTVMGEEIFGGVLLLGFLRLCRQ
jgi:hypothetical protein